MKPGISFDVDLKTHFSTSQVLNEDGRTTSTREKILTITVRKGWKEGTRIAFSNEGDQGSNKIPGRMDQSLTLYQSVAWEKHLVSQGHSHQF